MRWDERERVTALSFSPGPRHVPPDWGQFPEGPAGVPTGRLHQQNLPDGRRWCSVLRCPGSLPGQQLMGDGPKRELHKNAQGLHMIRSRLLVWIITGTGSCLWEPAAANNDLIMCRPCARWGYVMSLPHFTPPAPELPLHATPPNWLCLALFGCKKQSRGRKSHIKCTLGWKAWMKLSDCYFSVS